MHLDCLSSPHHTVWGGFALHTPSRIACHLLCTWQSLARHPLPLQQLFPALHESARKSIIFSQAAGKSITDVCISFHVPWLFPFEESESEHTLFLARWKVPEKTLLCHLMDSTSSVHSHSKAVPPMAHAIPQQLA